MASSLQKREDVSLEDCWDLSSLFQHDDQWEESFQILQAELMQLESYQGTLQDSADTFLSFLSLFFKFQEKLEAIYTYSYLKNSQDLRNSKYQELLSRSTELSTRFKTLTSFFKPELFAMDEKFLSDVISSEKAAPFKDYLEKSIRFKAHVLSDKEEKLLSVLNTVFGSPNLIYQTLVNADFQFSGVQTKEGEQSLSPASFVRFLHDEDGEVRKDAFEKFYQTYDQHKNGLAEIYIAAVKRNCALAKIKNYPSALEASLFVDRIPLSVYENLIATVAEYLPSLKKYYQLRKRVLGLNKQSIYDTKVPLIAGAKVPCTFDSGIEDVLQACEILGSDYQEVLEKGLKGGWADRYENIGKRQGAFSAGTYQGAPYILMNFQTNMLDSVFTLAHEAGHSMHSYYSTKNNAFQNYKYTIFVAEVASTFNEELLYHFYRKKYEGQAEIAKMLINKRIDDIIGTAFRQTMFAEFEMQVHQAYESGKTLALNFLQNGYSQLLKKYFCDEVDIPELLHLECLRIPHFYNQFYVYKYATGISAATCLSEKVLSDASKVKDYRKFLTLGGQGYPIDQLKIAGADLTTPEPVALTMKRFDALVHELDQLLT